MAIEIKRYKAFEKGTLRAFFTIYIPEWHLEIRDLALHEKNGKRWANLPAKQYQDQDETKYMPLVKIDDDVRDRFQEAVLKAVQEHLIAKGDEPTDSEIPF